MCFIQVLDYELLAQGIVLIQVQQELLHGRVTVEEEIDGLAQERPNSSALAMKLCLSSINPPKWELQSMEK